MSKRYLGIISLLYVAIISYTIFTNTLSNYIAPNIQIYIKISIVPLAIIGLVVLANGVNYKFKYSDLLLLLPLIALIISVDGRLTTSLAQNRITANKQEVVEEKKEESEEVVQPIDENKTYDFTNVDFDIVDASYDELSQYLTFSKNAKVYNGMTIRVRGFTLTDAEYIPEGYFMIGKYSVNCCAADSTYVPFFARTDETIKNNTWYEIEGVLEVIPDNEYQFIMGIKVVNIKQISSKNEELYVYPCYAYDDGLCEETKKYNLVY